MVYWKKHPNKIHYFIGTFIRSLANEMSLNYINCWHRKRWVLFWSRLFGCGPGDFDWFGRGWWTKFGRRPLTAGHGTYWNFRPDQIVQLAIHIYFRARFKDTIARKNLWKWPSWYSVHNFMRLYNYEDCWLTYFITNHEYSSVQFSML